MKAKYIAPSIEVESLDIQSILDLQTNSGVGYSETPGGYAKESNTLNWDDEQSDDEQY